MNGFLGFSGTLPALPTQYSEVKCQGCLKHRLLFHIQQFILCLECKIEFEEMGHGAFYEKYWATHEQKEASQ